MSRQHNMALQKKRRQARSVIACGNAAEEEHRSGIIGPKAGVDGMHSTKELAEHHARLAQMHQSKTTFGNQLGKRLIGVGSKDFWHSINPLHRNFWGGTVPGVVGNLIAPGAGFVTGTAGHSLLAHHDIRSNKAAALKHGAMAMHYAGLHAQGTQYVKKADHEAKFDR